jgi:hypothetical protein
VTHRLIALLDEEFRLKQLRRIVDQTAADLRWNRVSSSEVHDRIAETRRRVLELFPEGGELFDLIFQSRFDRIIRERQKANADRKDINIIDPDRVGL